MTQINLRDIVLHKKTKRFGSVDRIDHHLGTLSFHTNAWRAPAQQIKAYVHDCQYLGSQWPQAWAALEQAGIQDPRIPNYVQPPAPVTVVNGAYKATVVKRNGLAHVSALFYDKSEPLINAFLSYELPQTLGRALILACSTSGTRNPFIGWGYQLRPVSQSGFITFRGERFSILPDTFTSAGAYELGAALGEMGFIMECRAKIAQYIGVLTIDPIKAAS